jgi:hypothetical protein
MDSNRRAIINTLAGRIRGLERPGFEGPARSYIPTPFNALNEMLPGRGLSLGALTEILAEEGSGALTLAFALAKEVIERGTAWAVVDPDCTFYPPAAAALGLDLKRLILLRPQLKQVGWCFTQVLRCAEIGAGFLATSSGDNMFYRRFQLAVERGGGHGFIIRPSDALRKPCWAALRLRIAALENDAELELAVNPRRNVRVKVLHLRGGSAQRRATAIITPLPLALPTPSPSLISTLTGS